MTTTTDVIDLLDLDRFARDGAPYDWFARLRDEAPVWWHPAPTGDGQGFWVVSTHAEVVALGRCPHVLSSDQNAGGVAGLGAGDELQAAFDASFSMAGLEDAKQLLTIDPPEHTTQRLILNRRFTPRSIEELASSVAELTGRLLDALPTGEVVDFTTEVAMPLPMQVIGDLLGVDRSRHADLLRWSNESVAGTDPEYEAGPDTQITAAAQLAQLYEEMRADPGSGLVRTLADALVDGVPLSPLRYTMFLLLLTTGGNETTRNAMSQAVIAFAEHPDQWQALRDQPSLLPTAVEEILRWTSPILYFRRNAVAPMQVAGAEIASGDIVSLWYPSANRDGAAFADPDRFDITRSPNPHVTFGGGGAHFCLGAALARIELRILLTDMLDRYRTISLAGPFERLRSNFLNGIKHLPVRLA